VPGRRLPAALLCCVVLALVPAAGAHACAHARAARAAPAAAARSLACLLNAERARHGLAAVHGNRRLRRAAHGHAADMLRRGYFSHYSPEGSTPEARIRRTGYLRGARSWAVGEALAQGRLSPRGILRLLLNSPPHRAILLDPGFRDLGLGVVRGGGRGLTVAFDMGRRSG
jgi:uncharacterized protein YkwD